MIVATAGHVDHGKTSLVKALTGIDTDRLAEEKRRGLSIDLGFAHADLGGDAPIGFVDVPGHERFIRNMVAGVASIDLALLVIAADDGPMPQTLEHLAILEWLGVPRCAVALTKVDRVPGERVAEAGREIEALLASGPFRGAPLFPVVAPTGAGLDALRAYLRDADASRPEPSFNGHFRLAVDRSFTLAGAGLVVTGAVVAGQACVGDALVVSPQGTAVRLRAVQTHGRTVAQARCGQRCALNLVGAELKRHAVERGDWVVAPAAHAPTDRIDVRLGASRALARALRHDSVLQLHLAAAAVPARLATLEGRTIEPGREGFAQLVLERPIGALHGDRFIVRDAAGNRTLGGGHVVDPFGWPRGRARPARLGQLAALMLPAAEAALASLLDGASDGAGDGIDFARFMQSRNLTRLEANALLQRLQAIAIDTRKGAATLVAQADDDAALLAVSRAQWHALRERSLAVVDAVHGAEPDRVGPNEAALAPALGRRAVEPLLRAVVRSLVDEGELVRDGFCLRRPAHVPRMAPADRERLDRLRSVLTAAGLRPPIVGELAATLGEALPELLGRLVDLARRGHLVQVAKNRFFLPETMLELAGIAADLAELSDDHSFGAAAYRDRSGLGRNLTIEVLEFLDRTGVTRFCAGRRRMAEAAPVVP